MYDSPSFKRAERVSQVLHRELGQILVNGLNDPRVGFVTVTEVRMSDDLRNARVFVSTYGHEEECEKTLAGLKAAAGYLKKQIAKRVHLRYLPSLTFWPDTTLDTASRLDQLLGSETQEQFDHAQPLMEHVQVQSHRSDLAAIREARQHTQTPEKPQIKHAGKTRRGIRGRGGKKR
jgi:ribosome-binding factor A